MIMKTFGVTIGVIFGILLVVGLMVGGWFWGSYNTLVGSNETVDTAYAAIQSQYQRRFDLVPNLAEATKGFLQQEQKVFGDIAEARTRYAGAANGSKEQIGAMGEYSSALARLMVIVENYPQLKSNETVQSLMDELSGTENRINVSRDRYNETVRTYNVLIKSFPKNLIAGMFGFDARAMFESDEGADEAVKIKLTE
jgi:LemA protein